ncbi:MAG TPA: hypothetical protein VKZ79_07880 [Alphaproteobacteria bacterium]|nr:hypothetical protein [Alphaproteobacteria bacterium]
MSPRGLKLLLAWLLGAATPAHAADLSSSAFADFSLVQPSSERSWLDGGLGKLRWGSDGNPNPQFELSEIAADIRGQPSSDLLAFASIRYEPKQKTAFDFLEAYGRYRPIETPTVEWLIKLGAFFPPISLENEGIGWTSPWTITPSAINSWVGEELRTIGGETSAEWRFGSTALSATGAVFGWAGPAGTLLADRGWAMDDRPIGLLDHTRLPNAFGYEVGRTPPLWQDPFVQIGDSPGWYAGAAWRQDGVGKLSVLRYDNRVDPAAKADGQIGWHTQFTSVGAEGDIGDVVLLAQGMIGDTEIDPSVRFHLSTHFEAAYLLAGWNIDDWTLAGRADFFSTRTRVNPDLNEHGRAFTFDLTWRPESWLRLSSEALWLDSTRAQRDDDGLSPHQIETQFQFSARLIY